jgi:hypothetical protein
MMKIIDRAGIAAENAIYVRLGRALLGMVPPEDRESWAEILLHVEHVAFPDSPEAYVMELTLVRVSGDNRLLIARPEIMQLSQELDRLCKEQSGKAWRSYDFRLFQADPAPRFECRYTYPDPVH